MNDFGSNICIYSFSSFDNYINFCFTLNSMFEKNIDIFSNSSELFCFNNFYYLVIKNVTLSLDSLESFCACISEFGNYVTNSKHFMFKLSEYGKNIISSNAIINALQFT